MEETGGMARAKSQETENSVRDRRRSVHMRKAGVFAANSEKTAVKVQTPEVEEDSTTSVNA